MEKRTVILGKSFYFGGVAFVVLAAYLAYTYVAMGSAPRHVTPAQAAEALRERGGKQWVSLSGLTVDCGKPVKEEENGKVTRTFYIARDAGGETFVLNIPGACDPSPAHVYEGTLESAADYALNQIRTAGISVPETARIPYVDVGGTPASDLKLAIGFAVAGILVLILTWNSRRRLP